MPQLTVTALRSRWPGFDRWISDGGARGGGRLLARVMRDGVHWYFLYFCNGAKRRLALGPYDEKGDRGLSLLQARARASDLAALYRSGVTDLHEHLDLEREAADRAQRAAAEAARVAAADAQRGTLKQLLDGYVGHLERQGKQSAKDVRSIFTKHVTEAAPDMLARKAAELSVDDFVVLVGRLVEAGKGRTADKLRSYLRAAYQLALESKTDPGAPLALRAFGIAVNPIASIGALSRFNRARDRVLSGPELGAFLRRVDELDAGARQDALKVLLLLGGQRPVQLLRLKASDIDLAGATVTLYDGKGARSQPRPHVLPVGREAAAIFRRRLGALNDGEPMFSIDGTHPMRVETLGAAVGEIAASMLSAEPPETREPFQLRDLRRTCETLMASLGISSDVRAQIQSHGLGGVQNRHYDRHGYAEEKKHALSKWVRHMRSLKAAKTPRAGRPQRAKHT